MIQGRIVDLQPNLEKPVLELNFHAKDKPFLPKGKRALIKLEINSVLWHGTINSEHSRPYLHTDLKSDNTANIKCTELFISMGLAEQALLDFELIQQGTLRLKTIVSYGKWREGNDHRKRFYPQSSATNDVKIQSNFKPRSTSESDCGDIDRLIASLSRDFPTVTPSSDKAWKRHLAVRVIDCVLSLHRNYDNFVVPRIDAFEEKFPDVKFVRDLHKLIQKYNTPSDFVLKELNYNHADRARILSEVIKYLMSVIETSPMNSEVDVLEKWANQTHPEILGKQIKIKGFGLAGFQYLRMLMGANTCKPDKHIIHYVSKALGRSVSNYGALRFLEVAAARLDILLRDIDTNIWESSSRANIR